jgi:hypothetical protein
MNPRNESENRRKFPFESNLEAFSAKFSFETNQPKNQTDFSYRNESTQFTPCTALTRRDIKPVSS